MEGPPVGPHIWEMSHYCIDPDHLRGRLAPIAIASALGVGLVEWGLECCVTESVFPIDPADILPLVQLHFEPLPFGLPCEVGEDDDRGKGPIE